MGIVNDKININHTLLQLVGTIDQFNGQWPALKENIEHELGTLKHVSTIASIGSSTRIEGVQLSDHDIDIFLDDIEQQSFLSRDQQEVIGYKDLLTEIFESYSLIVINENLIKQLHKILLNPSEKDAFHFGQYKKIDNHVVAQKDGKNVGIVFKTSSPFNTPLEMESLLQWYNDTTSIHPIIKCAVFIVHFLAIHPFQDGNGRLSRALTTLILLKEGYDYVPYCSLESIIEKNKTQYYKALRSTQKTFSGTPNYLPWLEFFLGCLVKQQDLLKTNKDIFSPKLSQLQTQIMSFAQTIQSFQNSDVSEALNLNKNTVKINLRKLVELKRLTKKGIGKGTWYQQPSIFS